jgi:uncharacterized NAD(P)/FAD-binding protein YdhS
LTQAVAEAEIKKGADGLLDRIFTLMVKELRIADPQWCDAINLHRLNADTLLDAWFADRKKHDPFLWAEDNLQEVVRNKHEKRTVAWRYTVLRLHDVVGEIVPHLNEKDSERFKMGLARVFIDNYAAIPPQSIRRLLALREAGIISILTLGNEYELDIGNDRTVITTQDATWQFDVFIDARGQNRLKPKTCPSRRCVNSFWQQAMKYRMWRGLYVAGARIAVRTGSLWGNPWLMHDQPFVQGRNARREEKRWQKRQRNRIPATQKTVFCGELTGHPCPE